MFGQSSRRRTGSLALAVLLGAAGTISAGEDREPTLINPYADIDWDSVGYYDANLHTHTNFSDGRYDPHYAIDTYHALEYRILALTDHDSLHFEYRPKALYPWTELNDIFHEIKDEHNRRFDKTMGEVADEEWQNRDPEELGMISIEGSEISRTHHIGSLFNDYAGGTRSEEEAFVEIGQRGGLALFFHPGRYNRSVEWYVDFFERHSHVVGLEIYNQIDRYPLDRPKWDAILHQMMPDRPVWGFANDDTHRDTHFGRNRNVFMLSEFTKEAVFTAMKKGHFFLFVPVERGTRPPVHIERVTTHRDRIKLRLRGDYDRIEWITHNPEKVESVKVGDGTGFSISEIDFPANFVRAVIISEQGRTYTQPFGIER